MTKQKVQLSLFDTLAALPDGTFSNADMYHAVAEAYKVPQEDVEANENGVKVWKRQRRYELQTLKMKGLCKRVGRDQWVLTGKRKEFHTMIGGSVMLAYATDLGIALWGDAKCVAEKIDEPISLLLTSPPYPQLVQKNYGQAPSDTQAYIDWLCLAIEPIVSRLTDGGSIALNLGNDVFQSKSAARSTYIPRLIIALEERFALHYMDSIIWQSNKSPTPYQYAQRTRVQLYSGYESIVWFTNNPDSALTDNARISLKSELLARNVWTISNHCASGRRLHNLMDEKGLTRHQALMPLQLAKRAIEFFTAPGELLVDLFSGGNTIGLAAQILNRRWIAGDIHLEMLQMSNLRFLAENLTTYSHELLTI